MQKIQFIDLVIDRCSGGGTSPELKALYHSAIVEKHIENAIESLFQPNQSDLMAETGINNWFYDFMTKAYLMKVEFDETRDKYFSNLPAAVTSINSNSAVRLIYPVHSEQSAFLPRSQTDNFLMGELDVNRFMDIVKFTVESNLKIYYTGGTDLLCAIYKRNENVYAKLAVKFSELEDTDEITIPDGKNAAIFEYVKQVMMQIKPEDIENDNVPNQINNA